MDSPEGLAGEEARWAAMGRHLRELRQGRRRRQETLAREAGVSVATIRAVENHPPGRRQSPRTLEKLSRALGQPADYLSVYLLNAEIGDSSGGHERAMPGATRDTPAVLLTSDEREAVRQAGLLYQLISKRIVADGPARAGDLAELTAAIHVIQRTVMAQAAARAYPGEFRLLGEVIPITQELPGL